MSEQLRSKPMIHDGNHNEGFQYDAKGRLVFTDPDGQTTLYVKGQGTSRTTYTEPTTDPAGSPVVDTLAKSWGTYLLFPVLWIVGLTIDLVNLLARGTGQPDYQRKGNE